MADIITTASAVMNAKGKPAEKIASVALDVASQSGIPVVQQAAQALKVVTGMLGGVSQDRFIGRTKEVFDIFEKSGYKGPTLGIKYQDYKIGASQVPDKKKDKDKEPTYRLEFERLRQYIIARLNASNPGLGDLYGQLWPAFIMANKGNIKGDPIKDLKEMVAMYKPGTYKPGNVSKKVVQDETAKELEPVRSIMEQGLKTAGIVPPKNINDLASVFYEKIVLPSTGETNGFDSLDRNVIDSILTFVTVVAKKTQAGEKLPDVMQKIGEATITVVKKEEAKEELQNTAVKAGTFFTDKVIMILIATVILALVLYFILRKK